jgi:hypothetical protein
VELPELTFLWIEPGEIDTSTVDARWRPGLESRDGQAYALELLGKVRRCAFASAATGNGRRRTNVNPPTQKRTGGDHYRRSSEATTLECLYPDDAVPTLAKHEPRDSALHGDEALMLLEQPPHRAPIQPAVALRTRRPDGWSLAAVEHPELERRLISCAPHDTAKRIDLTDDCPLRDAANGRITRHLADRFQCARDERYASTDTGRGYGGLGASVAAANDDDVEFSFGGKTSRDLHGRKLVVVRSLDEQLQRD